MPLGPTEMGIIVALIFLLFGAKKIPELARSLGIAQREFHDAKSEVVSATSEPFQLEEGPRDRPQEGTPEPAAQEAPAPPEDLTPEEAEKRSVIKAAKELNIDVEGRSMEAIKADIKAKIG